MFDCRTDTDCVNRKSQIAIEYAHQALDRSPKTWLFWVHAETQARFNQGYRDIAEKAKIIGYDDPKADIMRLVSTWLCNESNGRWAMVVDNADDASVFFRGTPGSSETEKADSATVQLPYADYLPQTSNGSILFTSRSRDVAYMLTGSEASIVEVGPMDEHESYGLLKRKFTSAVKKNEADTLSESLDHMPLALTQAAAFINRTPRMSIPKYLRELDHNRARLLNEGLVDIRRDDEASNSIMTTWQISFEHIRNRSAAAARLLSLMSFFDRQGIPKSLLLGKYGGPQDEASTFEEDCRMLINFSLIKPKADRGDFEMHSLVQYAMKKWLTLHDATEFEYWKEAYVTLMDQSYPIGHPENWSVCQALLPHAQAALGNIPSDEDVLEAWASLSFKMAWYVGDMGNHNEAYKLALDSYDVRRILWGPDAPLTLDSLNSLAIVLNQLGRYDESKEMHERALEAKKRTLGADSRDTLGTMANLASLYNDECRWADAEELLKCALDTSKLALGPEHTFTLDVITLLATTYRYQSRWAEAVDLELQMLKARKTQLGPNHPRTLAVKGNLAFTYQDQGRLKDAEKLQLEILNSYEALPEAEVEMLAHKLHLSHTYKAQGRLDEAEKLQLEVLEASRAKLGPDHFATMTRMSHLAATYWAQGRYKDAEELETECLELRKTKLGEDHLSTLDSKASLAMTYRSQGRLAKAGELNVEVLQAHTRKLGHKHPLTLESQASLASTYREQGRFTEAAQLEEYVLEMKIEVLGEDHLDTLSDLVAKEPGV
ncbi:hypothetical protein SLS59_009922 [Nothophoma quercina]|uniref:DUF7779 domain-containing protein n=1 Tax=Nothophoma quercina TaxID=749835 RepID=A0ABR3QJC4_9PLEO